MLMGIATVLLAGGLSKQPSCDIRTQTPAQFCEGYCCLGKDQRLVEPVKILLAEYLGLTADAPQEVLKPADTSCHPTRQISWAQRSDIHGTGRSSAGCA